MGYIKRSNKNSKRIAEKPDCENHNNNPFIFIINIIIKNLQKKLQKTYKKLQNLYYATIKKTGEK